MLWGRTHGGRFCALRGFQTKQLVQDQSKIEVARQTEPTLLRCGE